MANWKSPGPDQVQGHQLKHLTSLHERLAQQLPSNSILDDPSWMPSWYTTRTEGWNDKEEGYKRTKPSNHWPFMPSNNLVASLKNPSWSDHPAPEPVLHPIAWAYEQKGSQPGCQGTKDQLLIDKVLTAVSKRRKTNLAMGWINYTKAYMTQCHIPG